MFARAAVVPRSQELVFLDPDDDLGTIRSKLEASTAEEIYVVIPKRSSVLRSPLDYRILARIANELSSETILVSADPSRRRLAQNEGFRTRRSLRTLNHLMLAPDQKRPMLTFPDWVPDVPSLIFMGIALALAAAAFVLIVPEMKVVVTPQTQALTRDIELTVDPAAPAANVAQLTMAGATISSGRVEIPGRIDVPGDRVTGRDRARVEVVITSDRAEAAVLPRGARVIVPNGPKFTTDQDSRIQRGVPARVTVTAVDPGTAGNVAPGTIIAFEGFDASGLQITNQRAAAGGTDRQAKVVTEEDRVSLRAELLKQAHSRALVDLKARAGDGRSIAEQSLNLRVDSEQFDQAVGTEAEQLTGKIAVFATATAWENDGFNTFLGQVLLNGAGRGMKLSGGSAKTQPPAVVGVEGSKVKLRTRAEGVAVADVSDAEIQKELVGKSPAEARAFLAAIPNLASPPQVNVNPAWALRVYRVEVSLAGPK